MRKRKVKREKAKIYDWNTKRRFYKTQSTCTVKSSHPDTYPHKKLSMSLTADVEQQTKQKLHQLSEPHCGKCDSLMC